MTAVPLRRCLPAALVLALALPLAGCAGQDPADAVLAAAAVAARADSTRCPFPGVDKAVADAIGNKRVSVGVDRSGTDVAITCEWEGPGGEPVLSLLVDGIGDLVPYSGHRVLAEREVAGANVQVTALPGTAGADAAADRLLDAVSGRFG